MRKILASILSVTLCFSLSISAFAATGYGSGTTGSVSSYVPPASSKKNVTKPTPSTAEVKKISEQAIKAATEASESAAIVKFKNIGSLSGSSIQTIAKQAAESKVNAMIYVDNMEAQTVTSRWYIDPSKASSIKDSVNLEVKTDIASTSSVKNFFSQFYNNKLAVISLGHKDSFGMPIKLAVRIDLSHLDVNTLVFYSYRKETNSYTRISNPKYFVDRNGYLHFTSEIGGDIIISDSVLTKK